MRRALLPLIASLFGAACSQSGGGDATSPVPRGEALYSQNCAPCHQQEGAGVPNVYPSLKASPAVLGDPVELAQWVLSQKRPPRFRQVDIPRRCCCLAG